jgi:hypothetical protein
MNFLLSIDINSDVKLKSTTYKPDILKFLSARISVLNVIFKELLKL